MGYKRTYYDGPIHPPHPILIIWTHFQAATTNYYASDNAKSNYDVSMDMWEGMECKTNICVSHLLPQC